MFLVLHVILENRYFVRQNNFTKGHTVQAEHNKDQDQVHYQWYHSHNSGKMWDQRNDQDRLGLSEGLCGFTVKDWSRTR